jgi:hypothetical protein
MQTISNQIKFNKTDLHLYEPIIDSPTILLDVMVLPVTLMLHGTIGIRIDHFQSCFRNRLTQNDQVCTGTAVLQIC